MHDREDGGVRTNAKGQRQHRRSGETEFAAGHASRITRVLCELGKECAGPDGTCGFFGGFHAAEFEKRRASGFVRVHPGSRLLIGQKVDIRLNLCGQVGIPSARFRNIATQTAQPGEQRPAGLHDVREMPSPWSGVVPRLRKINRSSVPRIKSVLDSIQILL